MKKFEQAMKCYEKCAELNETYKDLKKYKDVLEVINQSKTNNDQVLEQISDVNSMKAPCFKEFIRFKDLE